MSNSKRATEPKHNKRPENRLWTKFKRGDGKTREGDGGINPDASIRVAAVCGATVFIYGKNKRGRKLESVNSFANHGIARQFATDYDEAERRFRPVSPAEKGTVRLPFYQVRIAGHVVEHTNGRESAHTVMRGAYAKPSEVWLIGEGGRAELLESIPA